MSHFDESLRESFENQQTLLAIQKALMSDDFSPENQDQISVDLEDMEEATGMEVIQTFNEANQISGVNGDRNLRRANIEQKLERIRRECGTDLLEVENVKVRQH